MAILSGMKKRVSVVYSRIVKSIGFYPTLIVALFFGVGLLIIHFEGMGLSALTGRIIPFFLTRSVDAARSFLNTFATGILSLMVFSFTMIMLVVNQTSSIYSPRVAPGLITQTRYQVVLGFYIGTFIYSMLILINVSDQPPPPGTAIFLALIFGVACVALFVYFIHSISQSIQISNILQEIHEKAQKGLRKEMADGQKPAVSVPDTAGWFAVYCSRSDYLQRVETRRLVSIAKKHDFILHLSIPLGSFLLKDELLFQTDKKLDGSLEEEILSCFIFYPAEDVTENYLFGFKQIVEIAVKALSPGINDPGTAINALDHLTDLLAQRMTIPDEKLLLDDDEVLRVVLSLPTFDQVMYYCFSPIREYGKGDVIVMLKLLSSMNSLVAIGGGNPERLGLLKEHVRIIVDDVRGSIGNGADRKELNRAIENINHLAGWDLPQLEVYESPKPIRGLV